MKPRYFKSTLRTVCILIISIVLFVNFTGCKSQEADSDVKIEEFVEDNSATDSSEASLSLEYEECPFDKIEMTRLSKRSNWYDNGIFSSFFEKTMANAEWQYVGTMTGPINPNPYTFDGYDVYVVNAWDYQDQKHSLFFVPYSEYVAVPNIYAYDKDAHKMKLVYIDGTVYGHGNYKWVEGSYGNGQNDDPIVGNYVAEFQEVSITVSKKDDKYYLTYTAGETTLSDIPAAFVDKYEEQQAVMFIVDDFYPQYKGYVEVACNPQGTIPYSYNSLIEGVDGTGGDYSILIKN